MDHIKKNGTETESYQNAKQLLDAIEENVNVAYMVLMAILCLSAVLHFLINSADDISEYLTAGCAGFILLAGIAVNAAFYKKDCKWLKYFNTLVMLTALYLLSGILPLIPLDFILVPFINSFYFRPRLTVLSGIAALLLMFFTFFGEIMSLYLADVGNVFTIWKVLPEILDSLPETVLAMVKYRTSVLIICVTLVAFSVFLTINIRRFIILQIELMQKNSSTEAELKVARSIQEGILSDDFADNDTYAIYANMTAASEVGGDFYDFFLIDETHLGVAIGDVSGHGMAAALFMTLTKTLIKVYAQSAHSAEKVLALTNRYLIQSNPKKMFVTSWLGIIDLTTGILSYCNAGHNYPVLIRNGGKAEFLSTKPNFVLGRKRLINYREHRMKLYPGDKLVLYTDGVTEAQSPEGCFYGDDRLLETLEMVKERDRKALVHELRMSIEAFEDGAEHQDDATVLVLTYRSNLEVERPECKTFFLEKESFDSVTDYIAEECKKAGCDDDTVGSILVASSEILANIDSYAYENGGEIGILTRCRDRKMAVTFIDSGPPFNPLIEKEPDITQSLQNRKIGGLGIFVVNKIMSDVRYVYENGKNVLTIEKEF